MKEKISRYQLQGEGAAIGSAFSKGTVNEHSGADRRKVPRREPGMANMPAGRQRTSRPVRGSCVTGWKWVF